jgi:hypothetical protein
MRMSTFDPKLISRVILLSGKTAILDSKVFSLYPRIRKYPIHKSRIENLRGYWESTGRYLVSAMTEIETQITPSGEIVGVRKGK